jgi:hypothetical protein
MENKTDYKTTADPKKSEGIIQEALERFEESQDGSDFNRNEYEEDIKFGRLGIQWPEKVKKQREEEGRPCLTVNKIPSFIRQVVNDSRQNKPGIVVNPIDNGADIATAEVINGIIRSVQRNSNADVAFDTAIDHAVSGGFGFFRIGIDYAHDSTFDLEAKIERISNPLQVHWDVNSTAFDASDWEYCFVSDFFSREHFEKRWPDAEPVSFEADERSQTNQNWLQDDKVQVSDYYLKESVEYELWQIEGWNHVRPSGELVNTQAFRKDKIAGMAQQFFQAGSIDLGKTEEDELISMFFEARGLKATQTRKVMGTKVMKRVISGVEVLEEDEWPGSLIPVCPVWGEEVVSEGRRWFRSMIRDAKDPQAMFNFWRSASTELVALAPKAPFIGQEGFIPKGQKSKWESANTRSYAYLEYSKGASPPQRQAFAGVPAGALQEALNNSDDMKAIIGIYDSSLGARSNETSGRAILARQKEADVSNFHFLDNLSRAIRYAGQVLVDVIPAIYSARDAVRILGEDDKEKVARLTMDPNQAIAVGDDQEDEDRLYEIGTGKYDVTVKAGPSYASQREETREALIEIMRQVPGAGMYIGDIVMKYMDFEGSEEVEKRLKMALKLQGIDVDGLGQPGMPMQPGQPPVGQQQPGAVPPGAVPPGVAIPPNGVPTL